MSKTSEERIKIYLSRLSKYRSRVLKERNIRDIISRSDLSDNDIENIKIHFSRGYDRAQRLEQVGQLNSALKELEDVYLHCLHNKTMFASFLNLYEKVVRRLYRKNGNNGLIHLGLQAREFGISGRIDLSSYDENKKFKQIALVLLLGLLLIGVVSFITYIIVRSFIGGEGKFGKEQHVSEAIVQQGLPSITRASDLVVESASLASDPQALYRVEVEGVKVLVFEDAHSYQLKAGVISNKEPIKKIKYSFTVYDDLNKPVLNKVIDKISDLPNRWIKGVYAPLDFVHSIPKEIKGHPRRMVLDILLVEFFSGVEDVSGVNLSTDFSVLNFKYLGSYFKQSFGIYEANSLIEVFNSYQDDIKSLEVEVAYLNKGGSIIRSLRRRLISESNSALRRHTRQSFVLKTIFPAEIYPNIKEELSSIKIVNVST
ncbi:hypothetical protein LKV13_00395 [Borrelia sp. BU AG58]|uniref:hypothetical protein n=1 Tax=Borrelia sp. BU AG58 TaxID=2887345 RepID=UPI001E6216C5|nr:hypothetical protein [Borrelia sp. BU AG58]UER67295.1 hypothetical protein LKV13_00395 [Borrelia sp. BU AG58]